VSTVNNILERLNLRLDSTAFNIVINGTEARLYASWKQDSEFGMVKIDMIVFYYKSQRLRGNNSTASSRRGQSPRSDSESGSSRKGSVGKQGMARFRIP
jgi:hypothetical protein